MSDPRCNELQKLISEQYSGEKISKDNQLSFGAGPGERPYNLFSVILTPSTRCKPPIPDGDRDKERSEVGRNLLKFASLDD